MSISSKKLQHTLAVRDHAYANVLSAVKIEPLGEQRGSFMVSVGPGDFVSPSGKVVPYGFTLGKIDKTGKISIWTPVASHPRDYRRGALTYLEKVREHLFETGKLAAPNPKEVGYIAGYRDKVRNALMRYVQWPEMDYQKAYKLSEEYAAKIRASWAVHKNPDEVAKDIWEIEKESRRVAKHEGGQNPRTYHVIAVSEKSGKKTRMTSSPVTHREGVTILGKISKHPLRRVLLEENVSPSLQRRIDRVLGRGKAGS